MMPTEFDAKDHADCAAAERLIDCATRISDDATRDELMEQAYRLLAPLVATIEGALDFLADAYRDGRYGYPQDEKQARYYRQRLLDSEVVNY